MIKEDWLARKVYKKHKKDFQVQFEKKLQEFSQETDFENKVSNGKVLEAGINKSVKYIVVSLLVILVSISFFIFDDFKYVNGVSSIIILPFVLLFGMGVTWEYKNSEGVIVFKNLFGEKKIFLSKNTHYIVKLKSSVFSLKIEDGDSKMMIYDTKLSNILPLAYLIDKYQR